MIEFLIYDAKVAVLIAAFYMFYRLLLARETFHRVNRIVLLLTAVASFVLPLCVITLHETVVMAQPTVTIGDMQMAVVEEVEATPWWQIALPILFIIGMAATLGHTLWSLFRIIRLIRSSEQHPQPDGTTICVTGNADLSPFSWMHYIVMNRKDFETNDVAILTHERGHIRLRHSCDLLLVDTLTALQWFNPAMWMLRADLRTIHEYEADAVVLSEGINARQYQYLLISKAAGIGGYSLANGISHSTLKNRIHMMLHKKSSSSRLLKLIALLPIVATALALNAETVTDVVYDEPQKQIIKKGKKNATIKTSNGPEVVVVEQEKTEKTADNKETFTARGYVYDKSSSKDDPIVGAIVQIVGTKKGTVTGPDGKFTLEVAEGDRITASYVGYGSVTLGVSKSFSDNPKNEYLMGLQKDNSDEKAATDSPFDVVEQMPQFPSGPGALMEYLSKNIRYPEEAYKKNIQGRVIVTFVVEKDGSISDARVFRSIDPLLDAEALRVVNTMPNWTPGIQRGKAVRVKYTIPITFKLTGGTTEKKENYILEIDGKVVDDAEIGNIPAGKVASMEVQKAENGQPKKIIITTKK